MKLIVQPDDGVTPLVTAIQRAKKTIDTTIFRFDRAEIEKALAAAVARGVTVRALIAHTNRGGEKSLRKLELRLLGAGVTVARTADDLVRYHDKLLIIDRKTLYLLGFNYTGLDILKSRTFGVAARHRKLVQEAEKLFEADLTRQPYTPGLDILLVSPLNARAGLTAFIRKARKRLSIYDPHVTDYAMVRLLQERAKAGVEVRLLGKLQQRASGLVVRKYPGKRLHIRAIVRDDRQAFLGSQGLRRLELDERREAGLVIRDPKVVTRLRDVFEADWALTEEEAAAKPAGEGAADKQASA
ncbi:MAG TPA: phospholipase D-like domain-containing protein [Candidatus Binatia bacterium]|nr:phospholipase D-like domain-containing protein [Candidatus Binatia bacterium]